MKFKVMVVVAWLALVASQAVAQDVRLIGKVGHDHSPATLASVLRQANCNPWWVSKAIEDSKGELPKGRLILEAKACEAMPPASVVKRSRALLVRPVLRARAAVPDTRIPQLLEGQARLTLQTKALGDRVTLLERVPVAHAEPSVWKRVKSYVLGIDWKGVFTYALIFLARMSLGSFS